MTPRRWVVVLVVCLALLFGLALSLRQQREDKVNTILTNVQATVCSRVLCTPVR